MKRFCIFVSVMLVSVFTLCLSTPALVNAEQIATSICQAAPTEFGYSDNTEYQMQCFFSDLAYVDDCCIMVCSDSTNFNEFGVFHVTRRQDLKLCERRIKQYLEETCSRFMNGVIYDINEYPKFKNAKVFTINDYVIYTILDVPQTEAVIESVRAILR